ncbi:adenosylmethionine decarboxylase [Athelia psychrophila]|uniref:S-adenosylmethionine decarboxylase proenzyme n=1 Tax=Athelia psychrophila TaxID=1759441 RepID=A0A166X8U7_9AGAM|nr:adenosylmethionine decarboxylase [Fibularhizoctonia sp. CBS 109695]
MLDIVKCKVLSYIEGKEIDAYLLSESSLLVFPHRLILKTCGTTLNLLGLPRILEIARTHASLPSVYRLFYSRKSFMFPERQQGPHRDWRDEVSFLDGLFTNGSAYTVGKVNGDHWLLYLTGPGEGGPADTAPNSPSSNSPISVEEEDVPRDEVEALAEPEEVHIQDYTIEILMSKLSPKASEPFFSKADCSENCSEEGIALSSAIGISELFPAHLTTLDAYSFTPCGYSSNALLKWGDAANDKGLTSGTNSGAQTGGEGYYTIHVTPEEGWSYASFECNVPLRTDPLGKDDEIPDLKTLIRRIVKIFEPGRLTMTLFISSEDNNNAEEQGGETAIEAAQRAFKAALTVPPLSSPKRSSTDGRPAHVGRGMYKRTDKINYEFGGYDLAFASFELR